MNFNVNEVRVRVLINALQVSSCQCTQRDCVVLTLENSFRALCFLPMPVGHHLQSIMHFVISRNDSRSVELPVELHLRLHTRVLSTQSPCSSRYILHRQLATVRPIYDLLSIS